MHTAYNYNCNTNPDCTNLTHIDTSLFKVYNILTTGEGGKHFGGGGISKLASKIPPVGLSYET